MQSEVPADVMEAARKCAGEWNLIDAIAKAIMAERARCEAALSTDAEPVAWRGVGSDGVSDIADRQDIADQWRADGIEVTPLYAAPPAPAVAVRALDFDTVYVIPREMTEEEWSEVKYNVDRKANPDIDLWRIKEAVKYANFIAGHRGRSSLSAQVQDVAITKGWKLVPKDPMPTQLETAAFNLSAEYGPEFVLANQAFARDVYAELVAAAPAAKQGEAE